MPKTVFITQSNYVPWKGYFDAIHMADEFVLYDEAQYTKNDWRNRNRIKTSDGLRWLTIPVLAKGRGLQAIDETEVADQRWRRRHWTTLQQCYGQAPHFETVRESIEPLYLDSDESRLSIINRSFIEAVCALLGIETRLHWSRELELRGDRSERLLNVCLDLGATHYLSGPAARDYLRMEPFEAAGVEVVWMDYDGYPEYPQLHGGFEHAVSILDLLFHAGPGATRFMKSFGDGRVDD